MTDGVEVEGKRNISDLYKSTKLERVQKGVWVGDGYVCIYGVETLVILLQGMGTLIGQTTT